MTHNLLLKFVSYIMFVGLCLHLAQSVRLDSPCRIPWRYVKGRSFLVRWIHRSTECKSYKVILDEGAKRQHLRSYEVSDDQHLIIKNLQPLWKYGVKVECYNNLGMLISVTRPCRTKTFEDSVTTTTIPSTVSTPEGACGPGFFTCTTNNTECLPGTDWCNVITDCSDKSDERNCPGNCTEINKFHERGNFSCSRWNSPESACFFTCEKGWARSGPYYTVCHDQRWTRRVPTCILDAPKPSVNESYKSPTEIMVLFPANAEAIKYHVMTVSNRKDGVVNDTVISDLVSVGENKTMMIKGLKPSTEYSFSFVGEDEYGAKGLESKLITGKTSANLTKK